jgi:heparan-alpha-glucosaminide N-acetyltransferase
VVWLLCTFLIDVPGCGKGYLGPGGIGDHGQYQGCTGGAAGYIDRKFFGVQHLYQEPTSQVMYQTGAYDPEGLLGCLTSIVITYLGVQSGRILVHYGPDRYSHTDRVGRWLIWGIVLGCSALLLCGGMQNGGWIPICKNLWSLSFIFATAGMTFVLLALFYVLIDVLKLWNGAPWYYMGMNSIVIYCFSEILQFYFPFTYDTAPNYTHAGMLVSNIIGVGTWMTLAWYWFRIKFFIKI